MRGIGNGGGDIVHESDDFNNLGELNYGDWDYSDYPDERRWVRWWYIDVSDWY